MAASINTDLSKKVFGLEIWILLAILLAVFLIVTVVILVCLSQRRRSKRCSDILPVVLVPEKEIEICYEERNKHPSRLKIDNQKNGDDTNPSGEAGYWRAIVCRQNQSPHHLTVPSPLSGMPLPDFSPLGWGHWFTLRDLEIATNWFSEDNIIGQGGYGAVYQGQLANGYPVAVKKLLHSPREAEAEFRLEVEAIGHVKHKNLVRLLGYCIEGIHRLLVYEQIENGSLEEWLHGGISQDMFLTWEARIKVLYGTAKGLAYLHDAIDPKVVHRDIKPSNILIDNDFNAKLSDFGLAKLLDAGKSHVTTRVMGTFGYVAPEYAKSNLLSEKSDVYSYGIVLLEAITGRRPVDYDDNSDEVYLVDWIEKKVEMDSIEDLGDPNMSNQPGADDLKAAIQIALLCVQPDAEKRPRMSRVVSWLESEKLYSEKDCSDEE